MKKERYFKWRVRNVHTDKKHIATSSGITLEQAEERLLQIVIPSWKRNFNVELDQQHFELVGETNHPFGTLMKPEE